MRVFMGACQGGPRDGKYMEHTSSRKEFLISDPPRTLGHYVYSSAGGGCWIWEPATPEENQ